MFEAIGMDEMIQRDYVSNKKGKHRISEWWQDYKQSTEPQKAQKNCNKEYDVKDMKCSWENLEDIKCTDISTLGN